MVTDRQSSFTSSIGIFGSMRRKKPKPPSIIGAVQLPSLAAAAQPKKRDWNERGWIRIFCGPYRDVIDLEESSRMVNVAAKATAAEVAAQLALPVEYALWVQTGGARCRRLRSAEHPLVVQEEFCARIGWADASRRSRLAIDPQLKHLLRFYVGPAAPTTMTATTATTTTQPIGSGADVQRSGTVELLKGLVSPQWRQRAVAIVGGLLLVYPGNTTASTAPDVLDLAQCDIIEHAPGYNRLILKIVPTHPHRPPGSHPVQRIAGERRPSANKSDDDDDDDGSDDNENDDDDADDDDGGSSGSNDSNGNRNNASGSVGLAYSSSWSLSGSSGGVGASADREKVLFIGFEESWERDLWSAWLIEASHHTTLTHREPTGASAAHRHRPRCVDIAGSGLQAIPDVVLQSIQHADELHAGQNQLQAIGLRTIAELRALRVLRLPGNGFAAFPGPLLGMHGLRVLDLSDNRIGALPPDVGGLESLEELRIERNELQDLPEQLRRLKHLCTLNVSHNRIRQLPEFLLGTSGAAMRIPGANQTMADDQNHLNPPLTRVNLRSNQLRGSIILGNYGYLTQLDVSENDIEILDLSALDQLETLQCSRNQIKEITLNGRVLRSLVARNNDLCKISVSPVPSVLTHLDLSHNKFTALPDWIPLCDQLHTLFAAHNQIAHLPAGLFTNPHTQLHSIHLDYNRIRSLPAMSVSTHPASDRPSLALHELRLHNNRLEALPDEFFAACQRLVILNVSSNQLQSLPIVPAAAVAAARPRLERLYLTSNRLCDNAYDTLTALGQLTHLHAAYNQLNVFPDRCALFWPRLEELILSGNNLLYLPEPLAALPLLRTLRVHSNKLQSVPALSQTHALRTLDLAHNQLDRVNLVALVPKRLTFLDLSCNQQLHVDPRQLQLCRAQRPMSLVDVSGRNRASLPAVAGPPPPLPPIAVAALAHQENADYAPPWRVGFSETAGTTAGGRLFVAQLRLPCFCNNEGLFGLFDGEASRMLPGELVTAMPKLLLDERTVKETAGSYMRYTLLSAHRELRDRGQRQGVCALLCHVSVVQQPPQQSHQHDGDTGVPSSTPTPPPPPRCRFVLRVASVGQAQAILIRRHSHVQLTPPAAAGSVHRQIGQSASYPDVLPDPEVCEIALNDQDEYLVLGNRRLWDVLTVEAIVREIRAESNVILAAKRLQDIAQGYGAEENLSLIIVHFANLSTNSDHLMRELRSRIVRKQQMPAMSPFHSTIAGASTAAAAASPLVADGSGVGVGPGVVSGFCRCGCCCESNNNCCHSGAALQFGRHEASQHSSSSGADEDRSSPSGQSDITEMSAGASTLYRSRKPSAAYSDGGQSASAAAAAAAHERRSLRNGTGGLVRAVRARIDEEADTVVGGGGAESDSALSEEQFKCWEYMLEQNTQLLFDKELNTISKGLTKNKLAAKLPLKSLALSLSSPQLAHRPNDCDASDDDGGGPTAGAAVAGTAEEHRPRPVVAQYHASTPFLSRQFGSSRSFQPMPLPTTAAGLFKSLAGGRLMGGVSGIGAIGAADRLLQRPLGGPNAAYFGSLQRLMPYNLEYDFAAMRERLAVDESMEYDQRLQQYWGVATTEL